MYKSFIARALLATDGRRFFQSFRDINAVDLIHTERKLTCCIGRTRLPTEIEIFSFFHFICRRVITVNRCLYVESFFSSMKNINPVLDPIKRSRLICVIYGILPVDTASTCLTNYFLSIMFV